MGPQDQTPPKPPSQLQMKGQQLETEEQMAFLLEWV